MKRMDQIRQLLRAAEAHVNRIAELYAEALRTGAHGGIQVELKDCLEKLRSALDYAAFEVYERSLAAAAGSGPNVRRMVHFPIEQMKKQTIDQHPIWKHTNASAPKIGAFLQEIETGLAGPFSWLIPFQTYCNEGKHVSFVEQRKHEEPRRKVVSPGGGVVDWSVGGVRFGAGVRIMGAPVDPTTQNIVPNPQVRSFDYTVVGLLLPGGEEIQSFARTCLEGVRSIVDRIERDL
jgi:hypothetical protein